MEEKKFERLALMATQNLSGIVEVARCFERHGIRIIGEGNTALAIKEANVPVREVSMYTGEDHIFDGLIYTIHPKIQGGIRFERDDQKHMEQAKRRGCNPIDFVVINFNDFEEQSSKPYLNSSLAMKMVEITGALNIRAAATNYEAVTVMTDPSDYPEFIEQMDNSKDGGRTQLDFRFYLARKAFRMMSEYDSAITRYLESRPDAEKYDRMKKAELVS